jgi:hypothetical protein
LKNWLGPLVVACVALAILRVVAIGLAVAAVVLLVYASITRPGGTLAFLAAVTVFYLASVQPLAFIITFGFVVLALVVADTRAKARKQHPPANNSVKLLK